MSTTGDLAAANVEHSERLSKALQALHDIVEPAAPALLPPAPGWYFLAVALLLFVAMALRWLWRRRQAGAYRRQALHELAALRELSIATPHERISALAMLLRRVALHGAARKQVASLNGDAWIAYLGSNSRFAPSAGVAALLLNAPYSKLAVADGADISAAFDYVAEWIRQHRVPGMPAS